MYTILGISLLILLLDNHRSRLLFADAFANNLVETGIGCMTELSTDEVIMNEEVRPPDKSDFPKMHLAVLDGTNQQQPIEGSSTTYRYDPTVPSIQIAFVNPYPTSEFNDDLQFVIEVGGTTSENNEDSRDAEFVSGGPIGCDNNKRVSGRLLESKASVVLRINNPSSKLRVWAGWATGHNAVRLVPDLILEPGEVSIEEEKEEIEELEEEIREEEFQNTPKEKLQREQEEEKLEKLLEGDEPAEKKEEEISVEEQKEEIEELEEEIREEEFQNTPKEKLQREQEEEKLEKLLEGDDAKENEADATKPKLQRKRRSNLLQKPEHLPEGLIDPKKSGKNLVLEIARKDRERGQQRSGDTKSFQQQLSEKQLDLGAAVNKVIKINNIEEQKQRHKLSDHAVDQRHREIRDIPDAMEIYDDETDDDLPQVHEANEGNDDALPYEGEIDDVQIYGDAAAAAKKKIRATPPKDNLKTVLETSDHFLACAFFVAAIGVFLLLFGKRREKGRRDL